VLEVHAKWRLKAPFGMLLAQFQSKAIPFGASHQGGKVMIPENHHFRPPSYTLTYTFNCVSVVIEKRMPTNLAIDDRLIEEAQKLGQHRTKKEAVTAALDEYIRRHKQQEIIGAFGTIDYDEDYDYKRERRAKRG
jgi:hypothetical protein